MPFDTAINPSLQNRQFNCAACPASATCIVGGAGAAELAAWSCAVQGQTSLAQAGKALLIAGSRSEAIYSVRAGCLKSYTVDADGNERVRAFYLPGDLIGLDALGSDTHPANVVAVVPSQVCIIPRERAMQLIVGAPALVQRLIERTSRDLAQAQALAGDYSADQRVAAFLLAMRARLGGNGTSVRLPMTRRDIANYLRLATETVCRVLTRFESRQLLRSEDKLVQILQPVALSALASPVGLRSEQTVLARAA
jgi:CRP/FNR family transcriptional regulator